MMKDGDLSTNLDPLLQRKLVAPGLPLGFVRRPRLDALYRERLDDHEGLAVFAAAGSGKTVQAQLYAQTDDRAIVWLTLDERDASPSRLLSYLRVAVSIVVPEANEFRLSVYDSLEDAAAALAELVASRRILVVFDQCENVANSAASCSVIETFIDYLPSSARAMMLSRSELRFSLGRLLLHGRMARIVERDLALSFDEAQSLVTRRGGTVDGLGERLDATRGWVAGVAFGDGSWQAGDFAAYMSDEILDALPDDERRLIIDTSILSAISLRGAQALGGRGSAPTWDRLHSRHLPATTASDGTITLHPCLQDYLRTRLESEEPERLQRLQRAHASLLCEDGEFEDAVEILLNFGLTTEAAAAAASGAQALIRRGDSDTMLRWVRELGDHLVDRDLQLVAMKIRGLRGTRRLTEASTVVRRLEREGRLGDLATVDPGVMAHVGWAMQKYPAEGISLLQRHGDFRAEGVKYFLEVVAQGEPTIPPTGTPRGETDKLVSWGLMMQGRLDALIHMLPAEDEWPPRTPYVTPHPILGLVLRGEIQRARALLDQAWEELRRHGAEHQREDLWHFLEAWVLLAEGDAVAASGSAELALIESRETGLGVEPLFQSVAAFMLLVSDRVPAEEPIALLETAAAKAREAGLIGYAEWAQTFLVCCYLTVDRNEEALLLGRQCVSGMLASGRSVLLPLAGVYLAVAELRTGDEGRAVIASDTAYQASDEMGAFRWLHFATRQFPEILAVRLEQEPLSSRWRRLGAGRPAPTGRQVGFEKGISVADLQPFGHNLRFEIDSQSVSTNRLKIMELACFLTLNPGGVARDEVPLMLYPESDARRAGNHFRQVVHQLRKTTGLSLQRLPGNQISWSNTVHVDSADLRFERLVGEAWQASGKERLRKLRIALRLVDGPYLAASELEWASERRARLDVLLQESLIEAATLSAEHGAFDDARLHARQVLAADPYSESAYQILINVEQSVGTPIAAQAIYREAHEAMNSVEVDLSHPSSPRRASPS